MTCGNLRCAACTLFSQSPSGGHRMAVPACQRGPSEVLHDAELAVSPASSQKETPPGDPGGRRAHPWIYVELRSALLPSPGLPNVPWRRISEFQQKQWTANRHSCPGRMWFLSF